MFHRRNAPIVGLALALALLFQVNAAQAGSIAGNHEVRPNGTAVFRHQFADGSRGEKVQYMLRNKVLVMHTKYWGANGKRSGFTHSVFGPRSGRSISKVQPSGRVTQTIKYWPMKTLRDGSFLQAGIEKTRTPDGKWNVRRWINRIPAKR